MKEFMQTGYSNHCHKFRLQAAKIVKRMAKGETYGSGTKHIANFYDQREFRGASPHKGLVHKTSLFYINYRIGVKFEKKTSKTVKVHL